MACNFGLTPLMGSYIVVNELGYMMSPPLGYSSPGSSVGPSSALIAPRSDGTSLTAPSENLPSPHGASHCNAVYTSSGTLALLLTPTSVSLSETDCSCPPHPRVLG